MPAVFSAALPEGPAFVPMAAGKLPLAGVTVLAVEDSRFASEALRLLCQHSGARLRRAETLELARRHLALYQPDVVLVDIGMPDGDGVDLIRSLASDSEFGGLVLAISGDPDAWADAVRAGAAGFIEKPIPSVAAFQQTLRAHLEDHEYGPVSGAGKPVSPDRQALRDDLLHARALLAQGGAEHYVVDFLCSLARSTTDTELATLAAAARRSAQARSDLAAVLEDRIAAAGDPFGGAEMRNSLL